MRSKQADCTKNAWSYLRGRTYSSRGATDSTFVLSGTIRWHCEFSLQLTDRLGLTFVRRVFLPAADIPRFVGEGNVDLGITGQDMVAEADVGPLITEVLGLGFGKCKLQVQVPERGPINKVEDLCGKKVVTSFDGLAGKFFADLDRKTLDGKGKGTTIEYIGGSVEAACALGLADGIVDLVGASPSALKFLSPLIPSAVYRIRRNDAGSWSPSDPHHPLF